ncbi:MAG: GNAT family N-acetyltransferase [Planctomycetaceae bacterium]
MESADVRVYYLEMVSHCQRDLPAPSRQTMVVPVETPTVRYYRFLYDAVGRDYNWVSRNKLSDADLAEILGNPQNELLVLQVNGSPAGFADLNRQDHNEIELLNFGLIPEFIGRGFGTWFLQQTINRAWSYQPRRLWLHTCTRDHPAALTTYTKAGFQEYKQETTTSSP